MLLEGSQSDRGKKTSACFLEPRYPKLSLDLLEMLLKQKCQIVLITHSEFSPLIQYADVSITLQIRYHRFTDGLSPLICLINAFALDLYKANETKGQSSLSFFEDLGHILFGDKNS